MLFEGLSKKHSLRLIDITAFTCHTELDDYYQRNKNQIVNTLYKDGYYGFKFWGLLSENIYRIHREIEYIMRCQYRNAQSVYSYLVGSNITSTSNGLDTIRVILACPKEVMSDYWCDVYTNIMVPVLKRHTLYSPTMIVMIFLNLVGLLIEKYICKDYGVHRKHLISNYPKYYFMMDEVDACNWLPNTLKEMIKDEHLVYKELKDRHYRQHHKRVENV
jgi:hypothetical protein